MTTSKRPGLGEGAVGYLSKGWTVSIPCQIECDGLVARGTIVDLSYAATRITGIHTLPPPKNLIVNFECQEGKHTINGSLTCKLVHWVEHQGAGRPEYALTLEFLESLEKISDQLTPLFLILKGKQTQSKRGQAP